MYLPSAAVRHLVERPVCQEMILYGPMVAGGAQRARFVWKLGLCPFAERGHREVPVCQDLIADIEGT